MKNLFKHRIVFSLVLPIYPYNTWVFMGYYPQESLYFRPISTMGTLLRVHPSLSLDSTQKTDFG